MSGGVASNRPRRLSMEGIMRELQGTVIPRSEVAVDHAYVPFVTVPIPFHQPLARQKIIRADERLDFIFKVRMTRTERDALFSTCDTLGVTVAEFTRMLCASVVRELNRRKEMARKERGTDDEVADSS